MSTSTPSIAKFMVPPAVTAPRGALWAAELATRLVRRVGSAVWRGLHAAGQARASRELLALATARAECDPVMARRLRAASEAAAVRALALRHQKTEPSYAAELFAAADRHERLAEESERAAQGGAAVSTVR